MKCSFIKIIFVTGLTSLVLLGFGIPTSHAAISIGQQATSSLFGFLSSTTATFAVNPAPGDILCAAIPIASAVSSVSTVTGGGVTWAPVMRSAKNPVSGEIWCGVNSDGTSKVIKVVPTATTTHGFVAIDFTGIPNPSMWIIDTSASSTGSSTVITTGALSGVSTIPEIVMGMGATNVVGQGLSSGPTGGFTTLTNYFNAAGQLSIVSAWLNATGTASTSWTLNVSTPWVGLIAALKEASTSTAPQSLVATPGNTQISLSWCRAIFHWGIALNTISNL